MENEFTLYFRTEVAFIYKVSVIISPFIIGMSFRVIHLSTTSYFFKINFKNLLSDLHMFSTPAAFVLSQNQTLNYILVFIYIYTYIYIKKIKRLKLLWF